MQTLERTLQTYHRNYDIYSTFDLSQPWELQSKGSNLLSLQCMTQLYSYVRGMTYHIFAAAHQFR